VSGLDGRGPPCYQPSRLNDGGPDKPSKPRAFFQAAQFASLGLEIGLCVAIGAGIGYFADSKLGTQPWLMMVGLFCGIGAAAKALFDAAKRARRNESASNTQTTSDDGTQGNQKD
jgi:ATP synthase protein I